MKNPLQFGLLLGAFLLAPSRGIQPPPDDPKNPTISERGHFALNLRRLQNHVEQFPQSLDGVLESLRDTLRISFRCPEGSKVTSVTIRVSTRHVQWARKIRVANQTVEVPEHAVGYYIWQPTIRIANNRKTIVANNLLMINSESQLWPGKSSALGRLSDESILYHELLHGQLLIEAMSETNWQAQTCDCDFDYNPQDTGHARITKLVYDYLKNLVVQHKNVYMLDIPGGRSDQDTAFEMAIADLDLLGENLRWEVLSLYPDGSNVDEASFEVRLKGKKLVATGKLIEREKDGYVLVHLARRR